jgi:hypothetical protein
MSKEKLFWRLRRELGLRDIDEYPEADAVIRREIAAWQRPSIQRIRDRLRVNEAVGRSQ